MSLAPDSFETIKSFVLACGDRKTYCNMYNNNPHYAFAGFEVYLHPDVGQANIGCDPTLSDFDEMVICDWRTEQIYFAVRCSPGASELSFAPGDRAALTGYFTQMLATIRR